MPARGTIGAFQSTWNDIARRAVVAVLVGSEPEVGRCHVKATANPGACGSRHANRQFFGLQGRVSGTTLELLQTGPAGGPACIAHGNASPLSGDLHRGALSACRAGRLASQVFLLLIVARPMA